MHPPMLSAAVASLPPPPARRNYRLNTDTGMRNDRQRGRGDLIPRLIIDFARNPAAFRYVRNYVRNSLLANRKGPRRSRKTRAPR